MENTSQLVTAAYTIPQDWKERIEREAKAADLNASQYVRQVLREYFIRKDVERQLSAPANAQA